MSSNPTDHDLLVALRSEFKAFYDEFRRVSNGVGFPRCADRLARLDSMAKEMAVIHKRLDGVNSRFWWFLGVVLTTAIGLAVLYLKGA